jgi:HSP20 family molecular chaperone IbpA
MAEDSHASAGSATVARATADVYETPGGEAYVVKIPLPGLTREEIIVEADVDTDNVRVTLERGMLRIRAPKAAAGRPKVVRVKPEG